MSDKKTPLGKPLQLSNEQRDELSKVMPMDIEDHPGVLTRHSLALPARARVRPQYVLVAKP